MPRPLIRFLREKARHLIAHQLSHNRITHLVTARKRLDLDHKHTQQARGQVHRHVRAVIHREVTGGGSGTAGNSQDTQATATARGAFTAFL